MKHSYLFDEDPNNLIPPPGKYPVQILNAFEEQKSGRPQLILECVIIAPEKYKGKEFTCQKMMDEHNAWFWRPCFKALSLTEYPECFSVLIGKRMILQVRSFKTKFPRYPDIIQAFPISETEYNLPPVSEFQ